jgi:hypothetical protein
MSEPKPFTKAELRRFDTLTLATGSCSQVTRISARLKLRAFIEEHGKEKCDAMFAEIMKREKRKAYQVSDDR